MSRWGKGALLVLAALGAVYAGAQPTAYRCKVGGTVTYSQLPCPGGGGREVGAKPHRVTDKAKEPPQDRAVLAKRASLTPEDRQECRALDQRLREEERALQKLGPAATIQDEMPLVYSKKKFRELKC
ncbi:hypothetical protein GCM10028796_17840 [Ramlibacter monticola]|uniref:DUF4124 domain-containing protein n=1 Tax=Ramlibacter monticola TaxID=1926872 RepID=A0A936YYS8_9BURK|nr:hypothetical protein [Ramlibacter monticola]MBL0390611.1 hypothetical protein [Ramlibacter monticola]